MSIHVFFEDDDFVPLPMIASDARLIVWPGVGAKNATLNFVRMEAGEKNQEHRHADSEDALYVIEGSGTAYDITNSRAYPFGTGDAVFIPPGIVHAIAADRGEGLISVGGPTPADLEMLHASGIEIPGE